MAKTAVDWARVIDQSRGDHQACIVILIEQPENAQDLNVEVGSSIPREIAIEILDSAKDQITRLRGV